MARRRATPAPIETLHTHPESAPPFTPEQWLSFFESRRGGLARVQTAILEAFGPETRIGAGMRSRMADEAERTVREDVRARQDDEWRRVTSPYRDKGE